MSFGFPHDEISVANELPLEGDLANMRTAVLDVLGIDPSDVRDVTSGEYVPANTSQSIFWSEGFRHCTALLLRDATSGALSFTHSWPRDEDTVQRLRGARGLPIEAVLAYGAESEPQNEVELNLGARGLRYAPFTLRPVQNHTQSL